jgi:hypothetical protein
VTESRPMIKALVCRKASGVFHFYLSFPLLIHFLGVNKY